MRVFASWSGRASREIAAIFKDWIPSVLQDVEVYVSSQDIAKGDRWLQNVSTNLADHNFGISIITAENYLAPWILFEAGALAKSLDGSRLVPILCGIDTISMPNHPLVQFQYAIAPREEEMQRLVSGINAASEKPLSETRVNAAFEKWYPDFLASYNGIKFNSSATKKKKTDEEAIADLAATLGDMALQIRDMRAETANFVKATHSAGPKLRADATVRSRDRPVPARPIRSVEVKIPTSGLMSFARAPEDDDDDVV